MGGRGSRSDMASSAGASGASAYSSQPGWSSVRGGSDGVSREAVSQFNSAMEERTRTYNRQVEARINTATNRIVSEMSDSAVQRYADSYMKRFVENPTGESKSVMRDWLHDLTATKKNGEPTANARFYGGSFGKGCVNTGSRYGGMGLDLGVSGELNDANKRKVGAAMIRAARPYRNAFD